MLLLLKLTVSFLVPTSLLVADTKHEVSVETTKNRKDFFNGNAHAINNVSTLNLCQLLIDKRTNRALIYNNSIDKKPQTNILLK